jgi:hypothetical protein
MSIDKPSVTVFSFGDTRSLTTPEPSAAARGDELRDDVPLNVRADRGEGDGDGGASTGLSRSGDIRGVVDEEPAELCGLRGPLDSPEDELLLTRRRAELYLCDVISR